MWEVPANSGVSVGELQWAVTRTCAWAWARGRLEQGRCPAEGRKKDQTDPGQGLSSCHVDQKSRMAQDVGTAPTCWGFTQTPRAALKIILTWRYLTSNRCRKKPSGSCPYLTKSRHFWEMRPAVNAVMAAFIPRGDTRANYHKSTVLGSFTAQWRWKDHSHLYREILSNFLLKTYYLS